MKGWLFKYKSIVLIIFFVLVITYVLINQGLGINKSREEVVVFAAASLTESFLQIKSDYESLHPNVEIVLNFAGSQVLNNQIISGAKPSMYFSANMKYPMELVERQEEEGFMLVQGEILDKEDVIVFAKNELVLICPSDDDYKNIEEVFDRICQKESLIVLANEDVPVGKYTSLMLSGYKEATANYEGYECFYNQVVSYENDVKAVLAKVKMNEVDLGVVYRTDAISSSDEVVSISIPEEYNQVGVYGSLLLSREEVDNSFYDYIVNGKGQETLVNFGFTCN